MTTESPIKMAAMQASIIAKFSADPATASKLAHKMLLLLQKAGVSAEITLEFESLPASAAGGK